jgi:hypothetical protein
MAGYGVAEYTSLWLSIEDSFSRSITLGLGDGILLKAFASFCSPGLFEVA